MQKDAYFDTYWGAGWPSLEWLKPYFLNPPDKRWFFPGGNDGASLSALGVDGTEHFDRNKGRVDVHLEMWAHPKLGVLLIYSKWGGRHKETYSSKGDLSRLREWVRTLHNDQRPVGLFIPFEKAWLAVKEFIETEGELPKSIEWIANRDLPPNTFPDP
jgi:hypothetical protein